MRRRDGGWIDAPAVASACIVNIGDCLTRWTNEICVSTPHRVVRRGAGERYSLAFFLDPHPFARVEPIPACVAAGAASKYAPILAHDYLTERLRAT